MRELSATGTNPARTVVISQPMLFPWPGFYELVAVADVYVHLDDAKLPAKSFTNRIQVKHASGCSWMTIPLRGAGIGMPIRDLVAAEDSWRRRHRTMLTHSLARAPHVAQALELFDRAYGKASVAELLIESIEAPARYMGVWQAGTSLRSSTMAISGKGWQRILDIVRAVGGKRYVTAHGARNYLDHEAFEQAGVAVEYMDYSKTPYPQLHGEFTPYVTILDLIATMGPEAQSFIRPATVPWREFLMTEGA